MIDHFGIRVRNFAACRDFYLAALAPIGYELVVQFPNPHIPNGPQVEMAGLGAGGKPDFWLTADTKTQGPVHFCFVAKSADEVDAFHAAALKAGGKDNGGPGLREIYHPNYYGAFVLDPDGNNAEVVFHGGAKK